MWLLVLAVFIALLPVMLSKYFPVIAYNRVDGFRLSGWILQLVGMLFVFYGLRAARLLFGRPSTRNDIWNWLRSGLNILSPPRNVELAAMDLVGMSAFVSDATLTVGTEGRSVEERLSRLEADYSDAQRSLSELRRELKAKDAELEARMGSEALARQSDISELSKMIEESAVGGVNIDYVGAVYLMLGITLATIPQEIEWLLVTVGV